MMKNLIKPTLQSFDVCWPAVVLLAATFVLLPGCKKAAEPEAVVTVQAEQPEHGSISESITADAVLAPIAQGAIEPKISAPVKKFYVERGQRVHAGQLLAVLENADLTAAALDNQGAYEAAQASYAVATKAQVPEDQLRAESDLAQAKANLGLNQSIVKSRKQLFAEGAIPGRDLDTAEASLVQAQAAYDAAAKHLESVRAVTHEAALKQAQGDLTSAEGKLKGAQAQLNYSEIRSPIDGFVTDRPLFAGETAAAGTPLLTVMETNTLLAKAHIAQAQAQQLKIGSDAEVYAPGVDDAIPAKVSMISPALDPGSTTVEVWLKIDNRPGKLKVGTPVKVTITGRTIENAMKVPLQAILTADDGSKSVMVVDASGKAQQKKVALGISDGDDVQVLSGLGATDQVITGGAYGLDPGTKVKIGKAGEDDSGGGDDK
jgi:multidrug efflux pump subunit AcrA (membrane-fusion protein)